MLTDSKLKNLKPTGRAFKVADRDGMYVLVSAVGGISFRYNYRLNGRQETVVLGRYGTGGMSLLEAREALGHARKDVVKPSITTYKYELDVGTLDLVRRIIDKRMGEIVSPAPLLDFSGKKKKATKTTNYV